MRGGWEGWRDGRKEGGERGGERGGEVGGEERGVVRGEHTQAGLTDPPVSSASGARSLRPTPRPSKLTTLHRFRDSERRAKVAPISCKGAVRGSISMSLLRRGAGVGEGLSGEGGPREDDAHAGAMR